MPPTFGTVVNPTRKFVDYLKPHASNNLARSLVAVTTPQYASQLQDLSRHFPNLQTVGFACDTVPLGCQRAGFSYLVSESEIQVKDHQPLIELESRNWIQSTSALRIASKKSTSSLAIPAANTLFSTGRIAEIWSNQYSFPLQSLTVELQETIEPKHTIRPAKPLTDWLEISSAVDNMLKTLENQPAAIFLEKCNELMRTVDPTVYAELSTGEMVKVVAGGGGLWSPRASMLVLEAPAAPRRGEMLRFWLQLPKLSSDLESQLANTPADGIVAETAPQPQTNDEERPYLDYKKNHWLPVFGFGSEQGYFVGDHKHSIVGESMYLKTQSGEILNFK